MIILKFCILASGSAGNSTLVATEQTRILVDAGLSRRETLARLAVADVDAEELDAILISHEHTDHVAGLPVLVKSMKSSPSVPVFLTHLTAPMVQWDGCQRQAVTFQAGATITIGDIDIDSFTISHDAVDPVGFCFRSQGLKIGMVTDLGYITENVRFQLRDTDMLMLESNHELEMLKDCRYPWHVIQRIMSKKGHLSNDAAAAFLAEDMCSSTRIVVLGHISENSNHPAIVHLAASQALARRNLETRLVVAQPGKQTEVFTL